MTDKAHLSRKGFTLLELLLVVAIISLLSAISMMSLRLASERARTVQCQNNQRTIGIALQSYYIDHNAFPYADGNIEFRNSNLTHPTAFGEGPAANGYWSAVPFQLVDDGYLTNEDYLYCPALLRRYPERKEYLRYAYNHAPAMDYLVMEKPPVLYSPSSNEHIWVIKCLHIEPNWTEDYPTFPHHWNGKRGENVLYLNGTVEWEER